MAGFFCSFDVVGVADAAAGFVGVGWGMVFCEGGISADGAAMEVGRGLAAGSLVVGNLEGPLGMPVEGLVVAAA